jgi:hypothetical protein
MALTFAVSSVIWWVIFGMVDCSTSDYQNAAEAYKKDLQSLKAEHLVVSQQLENEKSKLLVEKARSREFNNRLAQLVGGFENENIEVFVKYCKTHLYPACKFKPDDVSSGERGAHVTSSTKETLSVRRQKL